MIWIGCFALGAVLGLRRGLTLRARRRRPIPVYVVNRGP